MDKKTLAKKVFDAINQYGLSLETIETALTPTELDTSFVPFDWQEVFSYWLHYKKEKKQSYRSPSSLKLCFKRLYELSNGDVNTATMIVEQSIANNYSGLFPLKGHQYGFNDTTKQFQLAANDINLPL